MSCATLSDVKWATYQHARTQRWGATATLRFEDEDKAAILTVRDGWMAERVRDRAIGIPEMEVNVLSQTGVSETVLQDTMRFVILAGRRHEKRTYEFLTGNPERHKMTFQPIGEIV